MYYFYFVNSRDQLLYKIDKPNWKAERIATFQSAGQIANQLKRAEYESRPTSKRLALVFNEADKKAVAAKVWYFLKNEIFYQAEPKSSQNAKTISRFLSEATGDCKHYATFAVGVLNACGIPAWFTFVGQDESVKKPNHVYCTCLIDGRKYTIDPCRKYFNSECRYFYKWDMKKK